MGGGSRPCKLIGTGDRVEVVPRQNATLAEKASVLLRGVGVRARRQGVESAKAPTDIECSIERSALTLFNIPFDQTIWSRAPTRPCLDADLRSPGSTWRQSSWSCNRRSRRMRLTNEWRTYASLVRRSASLRLTRWSRAELSLRAVGVGTTRDWSESALRVESSRSSPQAAPARLR